MLETEVTRMIRNMKRCSVACPAFLLQLTASAAAFAEQPVGLLQRAPATGGSTEVAKEVFQTPAQRAALEAINDAATLKVSLPQ
jgi:hypothetical protein